MSRETVAGNVAGEIVKGLLPALSVASRPEGSNDSEAIRCALAIERRARERRTKRGRGPQTGKRFPN